MRCERLRHLRSPLENTHWTYPMSDDNDLTCSPFAKKKESDLKRGPVHQRFNLPLCVSIGAFPSPSSRHIQRREFEEIPS